MVCKFASRMSLLYSIALFQACAITAAAVPADHPALVQQLVQKDLLGLPEKEILTLTVEYQPGGASLPHRHDAQVFVYVLQGKVTMQVAGHPAVTLQQGQIFYESPTDVHVVSANASKTESAKILVFIVKNKNAPVSRDVSAQINHE